MTNRDKGLIIGASIMLAILVRGLYLLINVPAIRKTPLDSSTYQIVHNKAEFNKDSIGRVGWQINAASFDRWEFTQTVEGKIIMVGYYKKTNKIGIVIYPDSIIFQ